MAERIDLSFVAPEEFQNEDFKFILQTLLDSYKPILERELKRATSVDKLIEEGQKDPPDCEEELILAERIFTPFEDEKVALRLLSPEVREKLGPIEQWRWCRRHIVCCLRFGWLLSRARTFQMASNYLYHYWLCIRRLWGNDPKDRDLTADEKADFQFLIKALAEAYKPFIDGQNRVASHSEQIADEVVSGKLHCEAGMEEAQAIFDRFFSLNIGPALFGKDVYEEIRKQPSFWFCRCWCLCSIKFGWCLGRARNLIHILFCLVFYFRCLRDCFRPLFCKLTDPTGCVAEQADADLKALVVAVKGSAGGGNFDHYILEWSVDGSTWNGSDFHYPPIPPGGGTQGNTPVNAGLLAYFDTTAKDAGLIFIRMTVVGTDGTTSDCNIRFTLFKQDVRILGISGHFNLDTSAFDPAAKLVENVPALCDRLAGTHEVSFAKCIRVWGAAFVGGCENKKIKRYTIDYKHGFETNPATVGWTNFWSVDYTTIWQNREMNMRKDTSALTSTWVDDCVVANPFSPPPFCLLEVPDARLSPSCWQTHTSTCGLSGLITLRLAVEDTLGNLYYDTQRVWIDNKQICAMIRIDAAPACHDLNIADFAKPADCGVAWKLPISGIAYDEYIDETMPLTRPNDNFDFYWIKVAKQGGTEVQIPISTGAGGPCFFGTSRVGNPGIKCSPCDPANPAATAVFDTLAQFDLRALDPTCSSSVPYTVPANLLLPRGECCVYYFKLRVQDRTIFSGGPHWREALWPVKICNNLS